MPKGPVFIFPLTIHAEVGKTRTNLLTYKNYLYLERSPKAALETALSKLIENGLNSCRCVHADRIFRMLPYK